MSDDPSNKGASEPAGQDEALLTEKEIAAIRAQARAEILADRKTALKKDLLAREKERLKQEEGLVTGLTSKDEMVTITIDLAEYADKILVNMRPYWHGHTYTVQRHVADSLREMIFRTWYHQTVQVEGKPRQSFYATPHETILSAVAGAKNAPKPVA